MGSITVNDIREALLDEKIIIKHNGIDIYIECPETKEQLIIPMTHGSVERKNSRVERMFGKKEDWPKRDPDEGQGPYKGVPAGGVRGVRGDPGVLREAGDLQLPVRRVRARNGAGEPAAHVYAL